MNNDLFECDEKAGTAGAVQFIERSRYDVPPDHYAVYDPADPAHWECCPGRYCRGAKIIKCRVCGKPATHVDAFFPNFCDGNVCDAHYKEDNDGKRK